MLSSSGVVSAIVASRAISPRKALFVSTAAGLIGPFLFGVAVASAIGVEVIELPKFSLTLLYAVLSASIAWTLVSWLFGVPSSSSHTQVGALFGAAIAAVGIGSLQTSGLVKIVIGLILAAPAGLFGGFLAVRACYWLARNATPGINRMFNRGQVLTASILGLAIGSNSAQRTMGMMTVGLVVTGFLPRFEVPDWVTLISAVGFALGNLLGGTRMMRSLAFFRVRPIHGFSAQVASAAIVLGGSLIGAPLSTTQITGLAIVGTGAGERLSIVRWSYVRHVLVTWILTTPLSAVLGGGFYVALRAITGDG